RQASERLNDNTVTGHDAALLKAACDACVKGVRRAHIISYAEDGALLEELFTRDGSGTLVSGDNYEQIRQARVEDIGGILELIQPLEEQGVLVRRSREMLETEIDRFVVAERDGTIVGCAALYNYPDEGAGELSCFAVDPSYRRAGRGDDILAMVEKLARSQGIRKLFVLTTQTEHWFRERGFEPTAVQNLPGPKLAAYNAQVNSQVFVNPRCQLRQPGPAFRLRLAGQLFHLPVEFPEIVVQLPQQLPERRHMLVVLPEQRQVGVVQLHRRRPERAGLRV